MRLIQKHVERLRAEDGFTLIELVISVAILGIVSAALCGVVLQYVKTTVDTSARLDESPEQQFISAYWQNDVSSLGRQTFSGSIPLNPAQSVFVDAPGPANCGSAVGTVVVAFAWNEFPVNAADPNSAWGATPQEVAYVTVPSGARTLLERVRCRNGVAGQPQTVARNLLGKPTISCNTPCGSPTSPPGRVSMTFVIKDADHPNSPGYTTTVSADRRQG